MTDRDLIELAAQAGGYDTSHYWNKLRLNLDPQVDALCIDGVSTGWNPLTDDGHALRLAVRLQIDIEFEDNKVVAWFVAPRPGWDNGMISTWTEPLGDDPCASVRRAIVQAAAAMLLSTPKSPVKRPVD